MIKYGEYVINIVTLSLVIKISVCIVTYRIPFNQRRDPQTKNAVYLNSFIKNITEILTENIRIRGHNNVSLPTQETSLFAFDNAVAYNLSNLQQYGTYYARFSYQWHKNLQQKGRINMQHLNFCEYIFDLKITSDVYMKYFISEDYQHVGNISMNIPYLIINITFVSLEVLKDGTYKPVWGKTIIDSDGEINIDINPIIDISNYNITYSYKKNNVKPVEYIIKKIAKKKFFRTDLQYIRDILNEDMKDAINKNRNNLPLITITNITEHLYYYLNNDTIFNECIKRIN